VKALAVLAAACTLVTAVEAADDPALDRLLVVADHVAQCKKHEAPIAFLATALQVDWYRRPGHDRRANVIVDDLFRHMGYVPEASAPPSEVPDLRVRSRDPVLQQKKDNLRAVWVQALPQLGPWMARPRPVLGDRECAALAATAVAEGAGVLDKLAPRSAEVDALLAPMWKLVQAERLNTSCVPAATRPKLGGGAVVELWAQRLQDATRALWAEDAEAVVMEGDALADLAAIAESMPTLPAGSPVCKDATARIEENVQWLQNWIKAK
jgi:hypothetical protein